MGTPKGNEVDQLQKPTPIGSVFKQVYAKKTKPSYLAG